MTADTHESSSWPELHRVRRAIVVVDVVESVRLMQQHEDDVIDRWRRFVHEVRTEVLPAHGGRMVKSLGDGMLLEFAEARPGLKCASDMLAAMARQNQAAPGGDALRLRFGLHAAEVVVDEIDIYGAAVNLTARLATLAGPDQIVASADALDELVATVDATPHDLGECYLKHIDRPVRAYRLAEPQDGDAQPAEPRAAASGSQAGPTASDTLPRPRLAVLTLDGAPADQALRSLVADEMAVQLSAHHTLDVVSRMSTRHVAGVDPEVLLRRLGVHYAVGGSCTRIGEQVRLTLELVFAEDQRVIWSHTLGHALTDLVADPAAAMVGPGRDVLAAIEAHETGRARSLPLASLGSYALLLGGVRLMHRLSRNDFERSHQILDALIARHPRHPDGHAWMAKWHILQLHQGWSADPGRTLGMAHDLARRALEHDDRCSVAMVIAGMVKTFGERKLDEAERLYQRTLDIHPSEPLAWLLKSMVHAFRGEGDEAVRHARQASALSPLDPMRYYYDSLGASAEASAGHYDRAIELAQRSLAANAMHASTLRILTIAYAMQDRMDEAREVVRRMRELEPDFTVARFLQRSPSADYAVGRNYAEALARAGVPR